MNYKLTLLPMSRTGQLPFHAIKASIECQCGMSLEFLFEATIPTDEIEEFMHSISSFHQCENSEEALPPLDVL